MEKRIIQLRSMPYEEYLKTSEWAAKREQALERDGRRCRACNSATKLNVHHRTYERRGCEDLNDLTTLCQRCHEHFHTRMSQDEIMERTYMAPILDPEKKLRENAQKWEYYLLGMLLQHPILYACVCGILSESDFTVDDVRSLYVWFNALADEDNPLQECIAMSPHLESAADKAVDVVNTDRFAVKLDEDGRTKTVVQVAIRIKENSLQQSHEKMKTLLDKASKDGDKEAEMKYLQQSLDIARQRYTLKAAQRLQR